MWRWISMTLVAGMLGLVASGCTEGERPGPEEGAPPAGVQEPASPPDHDAEPGSPADNDEPGSPPDGNAEPGSPEGEEDEARSP